MERLCYQFQIKNNKAEMHKHIWNKSLLFSLAEGTSDQVSLTAYGALELWDIEACLQFSQPER